MSSARSGVFAGFRLARTYVRIAGGRHLRPMTVESKRHGEWRSLVAHPAGGRAVAGSNPVSPISRLSGAGGGGGRPGARRSALGSGFRAHANAEGSGDPMTRFPGGRPRTAHASARGRSTSRAALFGRPTNALTIKFPCRLAADPWTKRQLPEVDTTHEVCSGPWLTPGRKPRAIRVLLSVCVVCAGPVWLVSVLAAAHSRTHIPRGAPSHRIVGERMGASHTAGGGPPLVRESRTGARTSRAEPRGRSSWPVRYGSSAQAGRD